MERFHVKVAEENVTVQLFAERMTKLQTTRLRSCAVQELTISLPALRLCSLSDEMLSFYSAVNGVGKLKCQKAAFLG